jgi:hypothetical protein
VKQGNELIIWRKTGQMVVFLNKFKTPNMVRKTIFGQEVAGSNPGTPTSPARAPLSALKSHGVAVIP